MCLPSDRKSPFTKKFSIPSHSPTRPPTFCQLGADLNHRPFDTGNETFGLDPSFKQFAAIYGDAQFQAPRRFFLRESNKHGNTQTWTYLFEQYTPGAPPYLGCTFSLSISLLLSLLFSLSESRPFSHSLKRNELMLITESPNSAPWFRSNLRLGWCQARTLWEDRVQCKLHRSRRTTLRHNNELLVR